MPISKRAAAGICLHGFGRQLWCATIFRRESYFELRIFAPPFGPPDLARCTSGLDNNPLFGGTEGLGETGQCRLDEPRFKRHPRGLAVRIKSFAVPPVQT